METAHWSIAASVLGFLGTIILLYPGWRVSRTMKMVSTLRAHAEISGDSGMETSAKPHRAGEVVDSKDVAGDLAGILEQRATEWRSWEHWLLLSGISLIALSFAVDLVFVKLA